MASLVCSVLNAFALYQNQASYKAIAYVIGWCVGCNVWKLIRYITVLTVCNQQYASHTVGWIWWDYYFNRHRITQINILDPYSRNDIVPPDCSTIAKPWNIDFELPDHSAIWQVLRRCPSTCQIAERYDDVVTESRGFEIICPRSGDRTTYRLANGGGGGGGGAYYCAGHIGGLLFWSPFGLFMSVLVGNHSAALLQMGCYNSKKTVWVSFWVNGGQVQYKDNIFSNVYSKYERHIDNTRYICMKCKVKGKISFAYQVLKIHASIWNR